jgi:hypothetical protein
MSSNEEEWRVLEDIPNYEVSSHGRVRHVKHQRIRKPGRTISGLLNMTFSLCGFPKTFVLAPIICATFHRPKPHKNAIVRYRDGDGDNLNFRNLYWGRRGHADRCP